MLIKTNAKPDLWGGISESNEECPECENQLTQQGNLLWCEKCEQGYTAPADLE